MKHPLELQLERNHDAQARKAFIDMDGVIVDFEGGRSLSTHPAGIFKLLPGSYRDLKPIPGAIERITELINIGWDVWIATKIPTDNPYAAAEKLFWIAEYMPWFKASVIITPNKGCLGDEFDVLIDDRPHKAMCREFKGYLLTFGPENQYKNWDNLMTDFFSLTFPIVMTSR